MLNFSSGAQSARIHFSYWTQKIFFWKWKASVCPIVSFIRVCPSLPPSMCMCLHWIIQRKCHLLQFQRFVSAPCNDYVKMTFSSEKISYDWEFRIDSRSCTCCTQISLFFFLCSSPICGSIVLCVCALAQRTNVSNKNVARVQYQRNEQTYIWDINSVVLCVSCAGLECALGNHSVINCEVWWVIPVIFPKQKRFWCSLSSLNAHKTSRRRRRHTRNSLVASVYRHQLNKESRKIYKWKTKQKNRYFSLHLSLSLSFLSVRT